MEDLEEDPEYRKNVNIYRDTSKPANETEAEAEDLPRITLAEMLEDLNLNIEDDAMGEEVESD